ncbi:hypothetical protein OG2516_03463 [Oceanicola granulosus HTCC2516]|uniref:Glyoxalase-like domain-containing protein n=1 Tax=Oceanicola granulosus (strain ATCC BAA-861 / DSM 15982 / KCTC 12143 / HTCC2516) TaxID=314256 RepID=Q2CAJ3_OCEGH|nr:VOC family protein [Oceanicola granulosus]EAR49681.1 hypothetical protein OG2516_03463 [Oceanicola granulosus HTCC2516]
MRLDHIAVCCADLAEGVAATEAALGVALGPGGRHARFGTHNRLLGLGDIYLEVIAPEPGAEVAGPRWFGLDHAGAPRLGNWICAVPDLDAALAVAPPGLGRAVPLERGELHWRIAVPEDGGLPDGGAFPTLLEWGAGVTPPAARLPDSGCRLARLEVSHPEAERIAAALPLEDGRIAFRTGPVGLAALIDTPGGQRRLA